MSKPRNLVGYNMDSGRNCSVHLSTDDKFIVETGSHQIVDIELQIFSSGH